MQEKSYNDLLKENLEYKKKFLYLERAICEIRMHEIDKLIEDLGCNTVEFKEVKDFNLMEDEAPLQPSEPEKPKRKKHGGRKKGSKNKATLLKEEQARKQEQSIKVAEALKAVKISKMPAPSIIHSAPENGGTLFSKFTPIDLKDQNNLEGNSVVREDRSKEEILSAKQINMEASKGKKSLLSIFGG